MPRLLDIIKNVHTKIGYHIRTDSWKPSICYLNATTIVPKNVKPTILDRGCDCMITCKYYPRDDSSPAMMHYS